MRSKLLLQIAKGYRIAMQESIGNFFLRGRRFSDQQKRSQILRACNTMEGAVEKINFSVNQLLIHDSPPTSNLQVRIGSSELHII
jgi:hypothetical protein